MERRKAIPKKRFVSEEENNGEEEINLTSQDRIDNINWCKCRCECEPMVTFTESFLLLPRCARVASCHSAFMSNCSAISHLC